MVMKRIILATAAAVTLMVSGCGSSGPAPEAGVGEWSEVDDIGVRVFTDDVSPMLTIEINNHRDEQVDRETIELVSLEGDKVDAPFAEDEFAETFVNDIPAGESVTGQIVVGTQYDGAELVVGVDGIEFPFNLSEQ